MTGQSPLVGYNTNVRHKGKLYHIQTEDSGVNHPHVITHLFADGGRIIASRKTGYAEHLGSKELANIVKKLMQEQHKAMFIELRDCVYDSEPPSAPASASQPAAQRAPESPKQPPPVPDQLRPHAQAPEAWASERTPPAAAGAGAPVPRAPSPDRVRPPPVPAAAVAVRPIEPVGRPPGLVAPPPVPAVPAPASASQSGLRSASASLSSDDIDAFERAAEARLLGSVMSKTRTEAARRGLGRYQQTVAAKPARAQRAAPRSIFGGEALRGKSLDEVILSYLSDDASEGER